MSAEGAEGLATYRAYGVDIATDFPLSSRLPPGRGEPGVVFRCDIGPAPHGVPVDDPLYRSEDGQISVHRWDDHELIRFQEVSDYHIWDERILCHLMEPEHGFLVENQLLGFVLGFWMEKRGILTLHASAVVVDGAAVAFLAGGKGGKTSLAACFIQAGYPLLTDDLLGVVRRAGRLHGLPGYPQLRMWPSEAEFFLGRSEGLEVYHPSFDKLWVPVGPGSFGTFHEQPAPLAGIYLPDRRDDGQVEIGTVGGSEAVTELVAGSFLAGVMEGAGWHGRRFDGLVELATEVPPRRLVYPANLERLEEVRQVIAGDIGSGLRPSRA